MNKIHMPSDSEFIENLILQRTGVFTLLGGASELNDWFQTGDKSKLSYFLKSNNLLESFITQTFAEIAQEVDNLMSRISHINNSAFISIGPGNGLFELILMKKMEFSRVLLIDIEETNDHNHGFNSKGSGYASLKSTKEFLTRNGIAEEKIILCNPTKQELPEFNYDLLISILSMGFHYPCDEYVEFIIKNVNQDGIVVIDKRRSVNESGFDKLKDFFKIEGVYDYKKHEQFFFRN